jgi:hypothetical protein
MLEAVKSRVERPLLDPQQVVGDLLNPLGDGPPVHRLEVNRPEDQKIERALKNISLVAHGDVSCRFT